jgi:hypothetical protein
MTKAAEGLEPRLRPTAYAMAAEIMRSDGPLLEQECLILEHLAQIMELDPFQTSRILEVMDVLHASLLEESEPSASVPALAVGG